MIAASGVLMSILVVACGTAVADPVVARNVSEFYAAFLGRQLTREELRTLTDEYIRYHASDGKSREAILELSVAAVNNALQRARETLRAHAHARRPESRPRSEADARDRALIARYVSATERGDVQGS